MNFIKKLMSSKLLGKHYRLERFGVIFCVLCALMVVDIACILHKTNEDRRQSLSDKVVYTTQFTTSRTNASGTVNGIYVNSDRTKVFLLLKFSSMDTMSTDAKNYELFLTGCDLYGNGLDLKSSPIGQLFVFGASGYMGVYFENATAFPAQICDLVVRNNKELVSTGVTVGEGATSFQKFDQFRIYFNPGGAAGTVAEFLDNDNLDPVVIYEELVSRAQERDMRVQLADTMERMRTSMETVAEYSRRMQDYGVYPAAVPESVMGDCMRDADGNIVASVDPADVCVAYSAGTPIYLDSDYVLKQGVDFDWRNGSIKEGYLDEVCEANGVSDSVELFAKIKSEPGDRPNTARLAWYREDGTEFLVDSSGAMSTADKGALETMNLLTTAWGNYWSVKQEYQVKKLVSLLQMEAAVNSMDMNFSVRADDGVLILY